MEQVKFLRQGETGLVIDFGSIIDPVINSRVHALAKKINEQHFPFVEAVVPTYRSILVIFDPLSISREELIQKAETLRSEVEEKCVQAAPGKIVLIPTLYGGEAGPDLEFVATHNHITSNEVIRIHTSAAYQIYMIGFTPGFPYLGGMSEKIAAPRLQKPRLQIPAGSVGIAGNQTGLYPVESPGGWQLIGRTPLKVFNPHSHSPFLYAAGDFLQFHAISASEYVQIETEVAQGKYVPQTQLFTEGIK